MHLRVIFVILLTTFSTGMVARDAAPRRATAASSEASAAEAAPRFHHVAIGVSDLKVTVDWYCKVLGFVPDRSFRMEDVRLSAQQVRRGDFRVEIFQFDEPRAVASSRSDVIADLRNGGLSHFALAVQDVARFVDDLKQRGVRIVVPVTEYVRGVPVAFIADNEGNLIELVPESVP
jgi:catechol 2,3-dioxygenase-like lactoylglutathione lyase family enzyme